ncbi:MAG TPA: hypothetical protein VEA80_02300 [Vitreimonas sp.]|uniref:hypothetical protein n=1 Tax=Vitreimonas sp. TaxID=3069702 RepID=UPI002D4335FE|nr:hypothetical protein [Vitreimonas sp.]HYD86281.1 hypothetical protein [Vitreimonas sp.]
MVSSALAILGNVLELAGALLMAKRFLNVGLLQAVGALIIGLWRGAEAKNVAAMSDFTVERSIDALQGLALISAGFLLSLIANIVNAAHQPTGG